MEVSIDHFYRRKSTIFRFDETWVKDLICEQRIQEKWRRGCSLQENFDVVQHASQGANFMCLGDFKKKVQYLERALRIAQA